MENTDRTRNQGGREGRGTSQDGRDEQEDYEYKGGRQGTGGVPNPDDQDDLESAGSFRGTAEQEFGEDDDDSDRVPGARQNRNQDPNQRRNPK